MESLDNILSGKGETAPAPEVKEAEVTQATGAEAQVETTETPDDDTPRTGMVPHQALHAEKQKVKRYTEQVAEFDKTVNGLKEQNAALQRQMTEMLQRIPVQQQQPQEPPDFFADPERATRYVVAPHLEQFSQQLLAIAKDNAIVRFTEEKVNEAERAFINAMQSRELDPADYQKVVNSPNRYAAAVQWHQRRLAQAEIGDDPAAYKARVEAEFLEKYGIDPAAYKAKVEAQFLEKYGVRPGEQAAPAVKPVMPSNLTGARNVGSRSGPQWAGPPTLADIFKR